MNRLLASVLVLFCAAVSAAHPGSGIAVERDGTIIVTDIASRTIWSCAPDAEPEPLVRNRWTHGIQLDEDGTFYYEREEPVEGVAPCSFWRITPEGEHERLIAPQQDRREFAGEPFAVVESDVYYAYTVRVRGAWRTRIMKRVLDGGEVTEFAARGDGGLFLDGAPDTATVRIITAMTPGPDGRVYFTDRDHVRYFETAGEHAGRITTLAEGLIDEHPEDPPETRGPSTTINRLYALAVVADGSVVVAYQAGRRVIRIAPDGTVSTLYESDAAWSPIGVALREDDVYVLDVADTSIAQMRVTRLAADGASEVVMRLPAE